MYYSGIDLHKRTCFISTIDDEGILVDQAELHNDEPLILNYFTSKGGTHRAVVECTANWYWLSDVLGAHGIELVLAHAKYLKAICYAKVKTDKVDSLTLANLLRLDLVPQAHQIDSQMRGVRDLMRARLKLISKKVSCGNSIHRILEKFNVTVSVSGPLSIPSTVGRLGELPLSGEYQFQVECLCDQIRLLHAQVKELERRLHPVLVPNPHVQRLLTIPGIGKVLAFTIYVEVDGIERFETVKRFISYCRLVPGADNSGGRKRHKSGNKDGNRYLKMAFMNGAIKAVQFYPEIRQFYQRKARKKPRAVARTIVGQQLAKIAYHVLKDKKVFGTFKGMQVSRKKSRQWPRLTSPDFLSGSV